MTQSLSKTIVVALAAALLPACALNGVSQIPNTQQANLASNKLGFAVGTARLSDGSVGLNFVATLRQPNGLSGVLADSPKIMGPAGFVVPAAAAGAYAFAGANLDAGTNHISSSPQVPRNNVGLVNTTLGTFTGVFAYGFGPFNSDQGLVNGGYYPGQPNATHGNGFQDSTYQGTSPVGAAEGFEDTQPVPFFSATPMVYITGPPAVGFFNDGTWPLAFAGYSTGFTPVAIAPVAGNYTLSVFVAAANTSSFTYSQTAALAVTAALPAMATPTFTGDGLGGGSGTVTAPAGVTETMVYIVDLPASGPPLFFSVGPLLGAGAHAYALPDKLGPCVGIGCQNGPGATQSLNSGDPIAISAVGFDYPAFEAGPPGNRQQTPVITGGGGQADLTMTPVSLTFY